jgi:hypothetical protein
MRRAHDPSGFRRRRLRFCGHPQHQAGRAGSLRGQRQLPAGDKVELSRLAPDLQHNHTHRIAGERVRRRPQRMVHIGSANGDQEARIETEFGPSAHRDRARFNLGEILPDPHHGPPRGGTIGKSCNKTGRHSALPSGFRKHFMHRPQSEPALQVCIGIRVPKRHPAWRVRFAMGLDALDAAA